MVKRELEVSMALTSGEEGARDVHGHSQVVKRELEVSMVTHK